MFIVHIAWLTESSPDRQRRQGRSTAGLVEVVGAGLEIERWTTLGRYANALVCTSAISTASLTSELAASPVLVVRLAVAFCDRWVRKCHR